MPAARLGDMTMHLGVIGPVVSGLTVLISGQPAATLGDPHICPMVTGIVPHVGGVIIQGSMTVLICAKPAARFGDLTICATGPPGAVGPPCAPTVLIGG
jgi:uncharacterized Zn-binding protein involved in type VI secretion